ncbi:MAG: rhomboid family intramembrane serine protease [Verrucomicrobiales bacterium]
MSKTNANPELSAAVRYWPEGEAWFKDRIPRDFPWGDESLLEEVPESAKGSYGARIGEPVQLDGVRYAQGDIVVVGSREEFETLLSRIDEVEALIFPWYDRLVPPSLWIPHRRRVELRAYRQDLQARFWKALLITVGLVTLGFFQPSFLMLALLGATIYGLFPLVEVSMAWFRRVDRYTVDDLNRRLVNNEFFRRWMVSRPAGKLKIALALLILVFVGQWTVGLVPSIERAALVKSAVIEDGEWWRTVTTGLMHGNLVHILFNGMALYSLGRVIVALVSPSLMSIVFLFTVVTGSLASLWLGQGQASVGASGGILGCLGFLLVVTERFKGALPGYLRESCIQATIVIAIFGLLGNQFIDNAAHGGGFLGGILLGAVFFPGLSLASRTPKAAVRLLSWISLAVLAAGAAKIGFELWKIEIG